MLFLFVLLFEISNVVAVFAFWFLKELNANLMYVKYIHAVSCMFFCQKRISWKKATLFPRDSVEIKVCVVYTKPNRSSC